MDSSTKQDAGTNPVVNRTRLGRYPNWEIREYADGMYDAAQIVGIGLSPGFDSWREALAYVREEETPGYSKRVRKEGV